MNRGVLILSEENKLSVNVLSESGLSEIELDRRAKAVGKFIKKGFTRVLGGSIIKSGDGQRLTGYRVYDRDTGRYEADANYEFGWSLEDVEDYLKGEYEQRGLKW